MNNNYWYQKGFEKVALPTDFKERVLTKILLNKQHIPQHPLIRDAGKGYFKRLIGARSFVDKLKYKKQNLADKILNIKRYSGPKRFVGDLVPGAIFLTTLNGLAAAGRRKIYHQAYKQLDAPVEDFLKKRDFYLSNDYVSNKTREMFNMHKYNDPELIRKPSNFFEKAKRYLGYDKRYDDALDRYNKNLQSEYMSDEISAMFGIKQHPKQHEFEANYDIFKGTLNKLNIKPEVETTSEKYYSKSKDGFYNIRDFDSINETAKIIKKHIDDNEIFKKMKADAEFRNKNIGTAVIPFSNVKTDYTGGLYSGMKTNLQ